MIQCKRCRIPSIFSSKPMWEKPVEIPNSLIISPWSLESPGNVPASPFETSLIIIAPNATTPLPYSSKCKVQNVVGHPNCLHVHSTTMTCLIIPSELSLHQPPSKLPPWLTRLACHMSEKRKETKNNIKQNKHPAFIRLMYVCMYVWMYGCMYVLMWWLTCKPNQTRSSNPPTPKQCSAVRPGIRTLVNLSRAWVE